ncbi:MAG TPA: VWA domain-containing protein [Bacteroidetes bacterium]|nr:VWA domain-containing protein [Bacteroidota bacterium]
MLALIALSFGCKDDSLPSNCFRDPDIDQEFVITILDGPTVTLPSKISVFFKVTEKDGDPVGFLTEDDFFVYEKGINDGCFEEVSKSEADRRISGIQQFFNHSTMLVLDLSGSVLQQDLDPLKMAAIEFVKSVIPEDPVSGKSMGIWWFDGEDVLHELVAMTNDRFTLETGINSINPNISNDSSTDFYGAVIKSAAKAKEILETNQTGDNLAAVSVVLFTDGTDRAGRYLKTEALNAVISSSQDISFFTIGIGGEIDGDELLQFGPNGSGSSQDLSQINNIFEQVAGLVQNEANSFYLFEYCSPLRSGTENGIVIEAATSDAGRVKVGSIKFTFDATGFGGPCEL